MKRFAATGLVTLLVLFAFPTSAQADGVSIPGLVTITLPAVTVRVPGPVINRTVTLPGVDRTVTTTVTETRTRNVPQPLSTTTVTMPGSTSTVTQSGQTVTSRDRVMTTAGDARTARGSTQTITVTKAAASPSDKVVKVSVPKAVGISIGLLLLGMALGLVGIFAAYAVGYKDSEKSEVKAWQRLRNDLFRKR